MKRWLIFLGLLLLAVGCQNDAPPAVDFVQGDLAFVAHENSVHVVNVADPTQPEHVTTIDLPGWVTRVLADGRFTYIIDEQSVANNNGGLLILDMTRPAQPVVRATYNLVAWPINATVQDDLLVLSHGEGTTLLDVSDRTNPQPLATLPYAPNGLYLNGDQLLTTWGSCDFRSGFCTGGLRIYDVSNPQEPSEISYLEQNEMPGFDIALANGHAFITGKGVWVTELTGQPTLQVNGRYETGPGYLYNGPIVIQDNIAVAATHPANLYLLDISQPDTPTELSHYQLRDYLSDLTVRGQYAYLVGESGLEILDISDPANPQSVSRYQANP